MKKRKGLSVRQHRAIEALLSEFSVRKAAEKAEVSLPSLRNWLRTDTDFQAELSRLQREALDQAVLRLSDTMGAALSVTKYAMLDGSSTTATKLRAAEVILGKLLVLRDSELERRLERVETLLGRLDEEKSDD